MQTKTKSSNVLKRVWNSDEMGVILPLFIIIAITTIIRPDFLTANNFASMFSQIPFYAITTLGLSFPLMTGRTDLSTGKVAGFGGVIMAMLIVDHQWSATSAILFALACAVVIGLVNGTLVVHFGISDFVATMGTYYMVGGARYLFIKGYQFSLNSLENFPLNDVFAARYLGMPITFWIMLLLFAIAFIVVKFTLWGRWLLATGDNEEVAILAGIKTKKVRTTAYVLSAVLSCTAGILLTLNMGLGLPENGDTWEFKAIAGCAVGGVSMAGGKGSPLGALLGIILVFLAESAIIFIGIPSTMRTAVQGALMAAAVLFDLTKQRRKVQA